MCAELEWFKNIEEWCGIQKVPRAGKLFWGGHSKAMVKTNELNWKFDKILAGRWALGLLHPIQLKITSPELKHWLEIFLSLGHANVLVSLVSISLEIHQTQYTNARVRFYTCSLYVGVWMFACVYWKECLCMLLSPCVYSTPYATSMGRLRVSV